MKRALCFLPIFSLAVAALAAEPASSDTYEVLRGEHGAGSGFVIRYGIEFLGITSRHQFRGQVPHRLEPLAGEAILLDPTRVRKQKDTQALPVQSSTDQLQYLPYRATFTLRTGGRVIIVTPAGDWVPAILTAKRMGAGVYSSARGPRDLEVKVPRPLLMIGGSGGPVLDAQTGAVIGVLRTADNPQQARVIGFETLCLPKAK